MERRQTPARVLNECDLITYTMLLFGIPTVSFGPIVTQPLQFDPNQTPATSIYLMTKKPVIEAADSGPAPYSRLNSVSDVTSTHP
jgi:hypothetical protein